MPQYKTPTDIRFTENRAVEPAQLNELYRLVGWDRSCSRTEAKTLEMLRTSRYFIGAHDASGALVGFARVAGDPYIAQVLDVITHPDFRLQGVATSCMRGVVNHLQRAEYVSVTLTDGTGLPNFYTRFGFLPFDDAVARAWAPTPEADPPP